MAEMKLFKPFTTPFLPWGGYKIRLSHEEIEAVSGASSPAAALTGLIPSIGPLIAAAITILMWLIKKVDKANGSRGVVVWGGPLGVGPLVRNPDTW